MRREASAPGSSAPPSRVPFLVSHARAPERVAQRARLELPRQVGLPVERLLLDGRRPSDGSGGSIGKSHSLHPTRGRLQKNGVQNTRYRGVGQRGGRPLWRQAGRFDISLSTTPSIARSSPSIGSNPHKDPGAVGPRESTQSRRAARTAPHSASLCLAWPVRTKRPFQVQHVAKSGAAPTRRSRFQEVSSTCASLGVRCRERAQKRDEEGVKRSVGGGQLASARPPLDHPLHSLLYRSQPAPAQSDAKRSSRRSRLRVKGAQVPLPGCARGQALGKAALADRQL